MIHINLKFFELFICWMKVYNYSCFGLFEKQITIRIGKYIASTKFGCGFKKLNHKSW